ncbi:hypothetical protein CBF87_00035 [Limosilactobacillus reuteri]|nr:hypothetical protein CBF87_00035 [Limosilactobacillus reuteri]
MGRIFRNDGVDPPHNTEFTTMEPSADYFCFHTVMDDTEGNVQDAANRVSHDGTDTTTRHKLYL